LFGDFNDPELEQPTRAGAGPTVDEEQQQRAGAVQQEIPKEPEVRVAQQEAPKEPEVRVLHQEAS
jgi:hypothetical protein